MTTPSTAAPTLDHFKDRAVRSHCAAAMTILCLRKPNVKTLDPESLVAAAGHLKAIAKATGLTPPQLCDVLRIHGWRRRGVMPDSGRGYRFRMCRDELIQAHDIRRKHPYDGLVTDAMEAARPRKRVNLFKLNDNGDRK